MPKVYQSGGKKFFAINPTHEVARDDLVKAFQFAVERKKVKLWKISSLSANQMLTFAKDAYKMYGQMFELYEPEVTLSQSQREQLEYKMVNLFPELMKE